MSRTYREFGDLLSAYNEADEKWTPIQKAYELLDSVNENEIWEQRHAAADALFKYIAELEAAQRWRVVADGELPELYDKVLVYCEHGYTTEVTVLNYEAGLFPFDNVTHWMPLPEPPEEQRQ